MGTERTTFYNGQTSFTPETPFLDDIDTTDSQHIGNTIADLQVGDVVTVTNNSIDFYLKGEVIEKTDEPNGEEFYKAVIRFGRDKAELHANWRDIPPDADDQDTPHTGLILQPFNDTAPAITDIEVVAYAEVNDD